MYFTSFLPFLNSAGIVASNGLPEVSGGIKDSGVGKP